MAIKTSYDLTGGGWRLFVRDGSEDAGRAGVTVCDATQIAAGGALLRWLDEKGRRGAGAGPTIMSLERAAGSATPLIDAMDGNAVEQDQRMSG